ncbi:Ankyrin repeat domain-containing protein 17 (Gene trap ankyrin repeat protein) (Serologically defined breast cancer antigen NY-BR-16) [Durusdinium trenchii]|uniref:Ankyrin repeat domain-containing protein 17 (Gene trap ankyrin repeat protein) (Serologically defined breast cancer antigen NY-BR-16) n=3 Tax=Durusdinium trenchii TaxID=1381693 RepID=A0ABP0I6S7_9DINO
MALRLALGSLGSLGLWLHLHPATAAVVASSRPRKPAGSTYYPYRQLLDCEGSNFSEEWRGFRLRVAANAEQGFPPDLELLTKAWEVHEKLQEDATARSLLMVKILVRQEEVSRLRDFCLLGFASALFIMYRHELTVQYLEDIRNVLGWPDWPLDFSESSGWPAYWRMVPAHMEQALLRGDLSFSHEDHWGREEETLPKPTPEEVEAALLHWLGVSGKVQLSKPKVFEAEQLAREVKMKRLQLLVAGHHMGSSMEPYTMLRRALESSMELDLEVQFHGQRHPTATMLCSEFGFCHENEQLSQWMRAWEWKQTWEDDYEWMHNQWPEALEGLATALKSDLFLSSVQLIVCGGPAWFCAMMRAVKAVPMLLYFAWPLVPLIPVSLRPQFLLQIQSLGQTSSAVLVVANWILAAQFALQVRLPTPVQRVHGLYTKQQHSPVPAPNGHNRILFSRLGIWTGQAGPALLELLWSFFREEQRKSDFPFEPVFLSIRVRQVRPIYELTYKEMSQFYACVFWPWDVMMMLFNELYTMLVPLLVPDRHWVVNTMLWSLKKSTQNWWHVRAKNVRASLPTTLSTEFPLPEPWIDDHPYLGLEQAMYWYSLTDFEQFPALGRFRSFVELLQLLRAMEPETMKAGMRAFNEDSLRSSLNFYRWTAAERWMRGVTVIRRNPRTDKRHAPRPRDHDDKEPRWKLARFACFTAPAEPPNNNVRPEIQDDGRLGSGRSSSFGDDVRLQIFEHLWPKEWLVAQSLCRVAKRFLSQADVQEGLITLLSEDAFALTSPFWQTLRRAIALNGPFQSTFLSPAFLAMARPGPVGASAPAAAAAPCRGGRARLLGRCFTVAAQLGHANLVTLALQCKADIEQRINGQSALDGAAQFGQTRVVKALIDARAATTQTAPGRWTPLMRASQGGHIEVCQLLLSDGAHPDEWADRMTALDLAEAHQHARAVGLLRRQGARRFLELPPAKQKALPLTQPKCLSQSSKPRPRSSRGVLWGSAVLHLCTARISFSAEETNETDEDETEAM